MKKTLPLIMMMLVGATLTSHAQECYQSTRSKGISLCNQGKGKESVKFFEAAKDCPDKPANNDLDSWIKRCRKPESNNAKGSDKVTVESISFVGVNQNEGGLTRSGYYVDELASVAPKVIVDNGTKSNKKATIALVVKDPDGYMLENDDDTKYTESKAMTLKPGFNDVVFSQFGDYATAQYGTYNVEVWIDGKLAKSTSIDVTVRPTILAVNGNRQGFEAPLGHNRGTISFEVSSSTGGFKVKQKPTWVTLESQDDDSFTISYARNSSKEPRTGKMAVYTDDEKKWVVIDLMQEANPKPDLTVNVYKKIGINFALPNFRSQASTSVIDYGVSDVSSLAYLEKPDYSSLGGFGASFDLDIFLYDFFFIRTGLGYQHLAVKNTFKNSSLLYTKNGIEYHMDYGCTEKYKFNYLQIPVLAGYRLRINSVSSLKFNAGIVANIGLAANCKLEGGYSNYTTSAGYANSTYSGSVDLYSGKYSIKQQYSTGQHNSYTYSGKNTNPFKRFDLGLRVGAAYDFGSIEVDVAYTFGLSNIANASYFHSTNRIGGCLMSGKPILSDQPIYNYSHSLNSLQIGVSVWL